MTVFTPLDGEKEIPSRMYESWLMEALGHYMQVQRELGVAPPVYLFLGFANARLYRFAARGSLLLTRGPRSPGYLDREDIELGEIVTEDLSQDPAKVLLPIFDQVWQAFGFERSFNFDEKGKWI